MDAQAPLVAILEDDPSAAEALAMILRDWGAQVVQAAALEALVAELGPRLREVGYIITDFHLGDGPDGVSLVLTLASAAPHARVLVLSGSFHGRASAAAAKAGFDVMQKPARAEAIVAWLERR
ncbi:response regulator [Terricaulis sp.]|uniref:response regulator n=1 Tax=Terricaulis sp. TaxID=2768686 RepID=UPI003783AE6F